MRASLSDCRRSSSRMSAAISGSASCRPGSLQITRLIWFLLSRDSSHLSANPMHMPDRMRARHDVPNLVAGEVRVVDDEIRDFPPDADALGEVVMRGNVVMKGYFRNEEATETAFAGGWFHSGDVGVMHPDGSIELRDRKKDIIISGGENISTIEVEQAVV